VALRPGTRLGGCSSRALLRLLFQTRILQAQLVLFQYDVTSDGQRFLINSLPRTTLLRPLALIVNWDERLNEWQPSARSFASIRLRPDQRFSRKAGHSAK
jgi:hypothetical protein